MASDGISGLKTDILCNVPLSGSYPVGVVGLLYPGCSKSATWFVLRDVFGKETVSEQYASALDPRLYSFGPPCLGSLPAR